MIQGFDPRISVRAPGGTQFAEVFTCPGPNVLGDTEDGSLSALYGRNWLLVVDRDSGMVQLLREADLGFWERVMVPGHPVIDSVAASDARRFSVAFDQSARPVTAFEENGTVTLTWYNLPTDTYISIDFTGVDPTLAMDAVWSRNMRDSDVLMFFLSDDRQRVMARVQRQNYAVEHLLLDYGTPVILDRAVPLMLRYQLLVEEPSGAGQQRVLVSDSYPYLLDTEHLGVQVAAAPGGGELRPIVTNSSVTEHLTVAALAPGDGSLELPIVFVTMPSEHLEVAIAAPPGDGTLVEAVIDATPLEEHLGVTAHEPGFGALLYVILPAVITPEHLEVGIAAPPGGGSYVAA